MHRYLLLALKNAQDAQDVAQDVFERLLTALDRYDPAKGEFRPWLFSVVRHACADRFRQGRRSRSLASNDVPSFAAPVAERAASLLDRLDPNAEVRGIIDALPALQRRVLALRFVFDLTPTETADVIGSNVDAVRHVQHRALKSLAAAMVEEARLEEG